MCWAGHALSSAALGHILDRVAQRAGLTAKAEAHKYFGEKVYDKLVLILCPS